MTSDKKGPQKRLDIRVAKGMEEFFPDVLYENLASGIWLEEKGDDTVIKCYPDNVDDFLEKLRLSGMQSKGYVVVDEPGQDYAELTRKYFRPIRVGNIIILAPWNKTKRQGIRIYIEPGMAFGTGRHESTKIMLKLIEGIDVKGKRILDIGCGSAILSLYASILGAESVIAVDNDEETVFSARKNLDLNNTANIELLCSDLQHVTGAYDIVLANIDIRTFTAHSDHIETLVRKGGHLIVSGILGRDRKKLLALFDHFSLCSIEAKNAWRGFVFQKPVL
jgi:ribosomal protein L11 methyltransferase